MVKNLPPNAGDTGNAGSIPGQGWDRAGDDPLEEEMATHSDILAWKIPLIEEPDGLRSLGSQESEVT